MDDDHIKNFVTEVQEIRSVLLAAKEDLDEEGISSQERERSIKLADFIMKKVDNASTRVRDIFHKTFDYDKDELSAKEEEALTIEVSRLLTNTMLESLSQSNSSPAGKALQVPSVGRQKRNASSP
ncbi:hypothetical protein Y032_0006g2783 [Ancylostoma ceylanicum]|uniref:Uncharacterized protein n=1 Tax=Ancylostoma ceylanicum TaxID=53326 RepID=A0A016VP71_9BILA|nr:hypothetical protein Y032_0006g2783 [Ancylostoma ceylanicum]